MLPITRSELLHGYHKSVENAFELLQAAITLIESHPSIALGLAEIGQEELGKSLTCLAAIALPQDAPSFRWFWKAWKDHRVKAYRAHLYELISPTRFEFIDPDGCNHLKISERAHIPLEKEASFYVNYDLNGGSFLSPKDSVLGLEPYNRIIVLLSLAYTAFYVAAALEEGDSDFRQETFAHIALLICSSNIYQQDMPEVFRQLAMRSAQHASLVTAMELHISRAIKCLADTFSTPESGCKGG